MSENIIKYPAWTRGERKLLKEGKATKKNETVVGRETKKQRTGLGVK